MRILLKVISLVGVISINSCGADVSESTAENKEETSLLDYYFSHFPESPFLNFQFDAAAEQVSEILVQENFVESQNVEGTWLSEDKKTKVLVTADGKLGNFKVFFLDKNESFYANLTEKLEKSSKKSQKTSNNDEFMYFQFETERHNYSVSLFQFDKVIRLNYKLQLSH